MEDFISFLKDYDLYDEEIVYRFLFSSFRYSDMKYEFSGCIYVCDKDGKLEKIKVCVPRMDDDIEVIVNIHEYIHYYLLYKKIGKEFIIGKNCEVLPILYERLYVIWKGNSELFDYYNERVNSIIKNDEMSYKYAVEVQDKLLELYYRCGKVKRLEKR